MNEMDLATEILPDTCLITNATIYNIIEYEGIPETFLLNILVWCILLLLFTVLRNRAWNYGQLALVQSGNITQMLYGNMDDVTSAAEESLDSFTSGSQRCCTWIPLTFSLSKEQFFARCGPDAELYLSFQKYLLYLMSIIMILSLGIILPVNFQGQLQGDKYNFGHTTISNLNPTSQLLWIHVLIAFLYVPLTILIMKRCMSKIPSRHNNTRTIIITNISELNRKKEDIVNYFSLFFPNAVVKEVNFAYDVSKLMNYEKKRLDASEARIYCEMHSSEHIKAYPKHCFMCSFCSHVDALKYYQEEELRLMQLVQVYRNKVLSKPLGIAFVTFESTNDVKFILEQYSFGTERKWCLNDAPAPSNIFWENLGINTKYWYIKAIIINTIMLIFFFFLTTPAIIVHILKAFYISHNIFNNLNHVVYEFLPTLLLWIISALMPVLVSYSDEWLSHWTRSKQNQAIMQKSFIFLLFVILILPSLGLTSAQAFLEWSLKPKNQTYRWECVFLPDKGAFFINYVITSALIGTALELIRFPELLLFLWKLCKSTSKAEIVNIKRTVLAEFPFGVNYAWMLLIFTVVITYSIICPLITPFGVLYICVKHFVDRHNLYFAYRPSNMGTEGKYIHEKAVKMVHFALLLVLGLLAVLIFLRGGTDAIKIITLLIFLITSVIFVFSNSFSIYKNKLTVENNVADSEFKYVAPVLINSPQVMQTESPVFHLNYGSSSPSTVENSPSHEI